MRALFSLLLWAFLLLVSATKIVEWTTDFWWFESLGAGEKWMTMMGWRAGGFVVGVTLALLIYAQNVRLALFHLRASDFALLGGEISFHGPPFSTLDKIARGFSGVVCLLAGVACANRYEMWAALAHFSPLGKTDAISGQDLSFFLWVLPTLDWSWNFFGVMLGLSFFVCALLYFYGELIKTGPQLLRVTQVASRHLIVLTALLVLWSGVRQGILALETPIQTGGSPSEIFGATQRDFEVPLRWILLAASLPLAYLLVKQNPARLQLRAQLALGWVLLTGIVVPISIPMSRGFGVFSPAKETQNIARHIKTTRENWQIDVAPRPVNLSGPIWQRESEAAPSLDAWSPVGLRAALEAEDKPSPRDLVRGHYLAGDAPIYRSLAQPRSDFRSSVGVILEARASAGGPLQITRRVPLANLLLSEQPGETVPTSFWAARGARVVETPRIFNSRYRFSSKDGVERTSWGRRLFLAWRFWSRDLLTIGEPISWRLDPVERAQSLYPFFDWSQSVATPILLRTARGENLVWDVEGFSRSRFFPDCASLGGANSWRGVNYLRPAIRLAFNAQTGAVIAVRFAPDEPFAQLWARIFETVPSRQLQFLQNLPPVQNSAFALARAQIFARYRREANDQSTFADPIRKWRIWNENFPETASPRDENGAFIFAFAQSQSSVGEEKIEGWLMISREGKADFWRPDTPVDLPELASPKITHPSLVRRGWLLSPQNKQIRLWQSITRQDQEKWELDSEIWRLRDSASRAELEGPDAIRLKKLWREWKAARQNGNWQLTEKRERELDALLAPSTKAPEPTP